MKTDFRSALRLLRKNISAATIVLLMVFLCTVGLPAHAQTFSVLHSFMDENDGAIPESGVTIDQFGNLYGTTGSGGNSCQCGVVYKMAQRNGSWILTRLLSIYLAAGTTEPVPCARVVFGPDGKLYGTTQSGRE